MRTFLGRYKEHPEKITDDELANIFVWLGINYRGSMYSVQSFLNKLTEEVFKAKSEFRIINYVQTYMTIQAAYPMSDIEEDIVRFEKHQEHPDPEGRMEKIKDIMRKYFPWRIDGDKIKYYDDLDIDDEKK